MDQFEKLPSNSNEVCSSSASASASASSPSATIPITQPQAQTPPQHSGLPPLPPLETRKPSREKSEVWDHFEKFDDVVETVKKDGSKSLTSKKRARCKYCHISYAADPNMNGTSSLKKHIESLCKKFPGSVGKDKRQKTLSFDQALGGLSTTGHTKEDWLRSCVEMVVMDELPFSVVEGPLYNMSQQFKKWSFMNPLSQILQFYRHLPTQVLLRTRDHLICEAFIGVMF